MVMENLDVTIIPILKKYGVKRAALFGSYGRGDFTNESDVDILILPPEGMGLGFVRLKRELESALNKNVDLVSYNGISPYLRDSILRYEKKVI